VTRATASAENRRDAYNRRVATATTGRAKTHALVWWWMAELKRLPVERQVEEHDRLKAITSGLNDGRRSVDSQ
jgi:hypothetical protein